jgi:hypothetical protein
MPQDGPGALGKFAVSGVRCRIVWESNLVKGNATLTAPRDCMCFSRNAEILDWRALGAIRATQTQPDASANRRPRSCCRQGCRTGPISQESGELRVRSLLGSLPSCHAFRGDPRLSARKRHRTSPATRPNNSSQLVCPRHCDRLKPQSHGAAAAG